MTFYIILQLYPEPKGWYPLDLNPEGYLTMKYKMQELKNKNTTEKYRLLKTSY